MRWTPVGGSIPIGKGDDRNCSVSKDRMWGNQRWPVQYPEWSKMVLPMLYQRSSRRESGERAGDFLRDLEDYGEEFELHSAGDQRPLEVFANQMTKPE